MRALPLLAGLIFFAFHAGAAASEARCSPSTEGTVACFAGKLCACRHEPGGVLTGRGPGMRWDCGALRPACEAAIEAAPREPQPPPFPNPMPYPAQLAPWR